jgi:hypothetical protein
MADAAAAVTPDAATAIKPAQARLANLLECKTEFLSTLRRKLLAQCGPGQTHERKASIASVPSQAVTDLLPRVVILVKALAAWRRI